MGGHQGVNVGRLAMPLVPEGPVAAFYRHLHALHQAAGQPSMRELQRRTRAPQRPHGINPTTIHDAFCRPRLARWEVVEAVVAQLGGDVDRTRSLWDAARIAAESPDPAPVAEMVRPAATAVPRELDADVLTFTGRTAQLDVLDELLARRADRPAAGAVAVLTGMGGAGKTALATHWAHRVAAAFPDGQIQLDLHGDGDRALAEDRALHLLLRSLGLPAAEVPAGTDDRRARYRSLTAGRQLLIMLDNAYDSQQVRPLLPGSASCLVLVTSRDTLPGLVSRNGAVRVAVQPLSTAESRELLRMLLGARVDDQPEAVAAIIGYCGGLPLALRIAAETAAADPTRTLADLAGDLRDEQSRLSRLSTGEDPDTDVRAVLSWSYSRVNPVAAEAFRLLGTVPADGLTLNGLAALTGRTEAELTRDALVRASLLPPGDRLRLHDVLRVYARELCLRIDLPEVRDAASTRLYDFYVTGAARARSVLFPHTVVADVPVTPGEPATQEAAKAWLESERPGIVAAIDAAIGDGHPRRAVSLAALIAVWLETAGFYADGLDVHRTALRAARMLGDIAAQAYAMRDLGRVLWRLGELDEALTNMQVASSLADRAGLGRLAADLLSSMGIVSAMQGRRHDAVDLFKRAVAASETEGADVTRAGALGNLGVVLKQLGRYDEAIDCYTEARDVHRRSGFVGGEAAATANLGLIHEIRGGFDEALADFNQALALYGEVGDPAGEGITLSNIGNVYARMDNIATSLEYYDRALVIAIDLEERSLEGNICNALGELRTKQDRISEAFAMHQRAARIARDLGDRYEQAQATERIAELHAHVGRADEASNFWRQALALYEALDAPEATELRERLAR